MRQGVLIVAGPTASGKSGLALALACAVGGAVINADSMQVYRDLRVLTARPTVEDEAQAPHLLYGVRSAAQPGSAAWWRGEALAAIAASHAAGRLPIVCGGTGLYLSALVRGLSAIPDPGDVARQQARALLAAEGAPALHARLAGLDPVTAARLRPSDGQRVARAWEVLAGTGRGLAAWQAIAGEALPWPVSAILLQPSRDELLGAIRVRFGAMLASGAPDEVRALLEARLDPRLPAMRACGVPELAAMLRGEIDVAEARRRAELATAQFAKRQATWLRHRPPSSPDNTYFIHARFTSRAQFPISEWAQIMRFVQDAT